jgi:hypothetical protein
MKMKRMERTMIMMMKKGGGEEPYDPEVNKDKSTKAK